MIYQVLVNNYQSLVCVGQLVMCYANYHYMVRFNEKIHLI